MKTQITKNFKSNLLLKFKVLKIINQANWYIKEW